MNFRTWIVAVIFLIWIALCCVWYTCVIKGFCSPKEFKENYSPPITFNKSSFECKKGKTFDSYVDSLKKLMGADIQLIITGFYSPSETNISAFLDLGLARAFSIKCLLAKDIDTSKIVSGSKVADIRTDTQPFVAHEISTEIFEPEKQVEILLSDTTKDIVTETEKLVTITFASNSSHRDVSQDVDIYLNNLAEQLKSNGKKAYITGHTDDLGETEMNYQLGRVRAWVIKSILLDKGVNLPQLITGSKGETEPIGDNKTEEGKHRNRRVEITF